MGKRDVMHCIEDLSASFQVNTSRSSTTKGLQSSLGLDTELVDYIFSYLQNQVTEMLVQSVLGQCKHCFLRWTPRGIVHYLGVGWLWYRIHRYLHG